MQPSHGPLVSVGLPSYQRPDGLRRILKGVISQTYTNLDIMVSDNCSDMPEIEEVLREFSASESRLRIFRQESNIGVEPNHTFLVRQSLGEYFLWLHDDDDVPQDFVERCLERYTDSPDIVLVGPGCDRYMDGHFWYTYANYSNLGKTTYDKLRELIVIGYSHPMAFEQYCYGLYEVDALQACIWKDGHYYFKGLWSMFFRLAERGVIHSAPTINLKKYNEQSDIIKWREAKYIDRPLRFKIAGEKVEKLLPRTLSIFSTVSQSHRLSYEEKFRLIMLCMRQFAVSLTNANPSVLERTILLPFKVLRGCKRFLLWLLGSLR